MNYNVLILYFTMRKLNNIGYKFLLYKLQFKVIIKIIYNLIVVLSVYS